MNGRQKIYTNESYIDETNVIDVLADAMQKHNINRADMKSLYDRYRGIAPIQKKKKEVRENINNKVNVNRAYEIVSFFLGYSYGEPIKYTNRSNADKSDEISKLNDLMLVQDKAYQDMRLAFWRLVCGTAYRICLYDEEYGFKFYSKDPFNTFVIYQNDIEEKPLAGVTYTEEYGVCIVQTVYTKDAVYKIRNGAIESIEENYPRFIPITEYPMNEARMGVFEPVCSLMDAIDALESNMLDEVEQNVNAFIAIIGASIDKKTMEDLNVYKMLCLPEGVDIRTLTTNAIQSNISSITDGLYNDILTIVGMPNRNGGSSTSDTGSAVVLRDGWTNSETYAKSDEVYFVSAERDFLRKVLRLLSLKNILTLDVSDVDITSNRTNTENLVAKTQALLNLRSAGVADEVAYATPKIWSDPNAVCQMSKESIARVDNAGKTDNADKVVADETSGNTEIVSAT